MPMRFWRGRWPELSAASDHWCSTTTCAAHHYYFRSSCTGGMETSDIEADHARTGTGGRTGGSAAPDSIHRPTSQLKPINRSSHTVKCLPGKLPLEPGNEKQLLLTTPSTPVPCLRLHLYLHRQHVTVSHYNSRSTCVIRPIGFRTPVVTNLAVIGSVN